MRYRESQKTTLESEFADDIISRDIVAFLNASGGTIYVGVNDDGSVVGVEQIEENLRRLRDIVSSKIEPVPLNLIKTSILIEDGVLVMEITVSKDFHSPYCIRKYGLSEKGCPVRIGSTCKELSTPEIQLLHQKGFEFPSDYMLEIPSSLSELSFETLQIALSQKGYHVDNLSLEMNYHLRNSNGEYNLLAELISDHNSTHMLFVKFKGTTKAAVSQRNNYGKTSIIESYHQIRSILVSENVCTVDTTVRPRKETYLFDIEAITDAIINALLQNDWSIKEPCINMFDDRMEIISHGGLPDNNTKEEFLKGKSIPGNTALMRIFQDLDITEASGHGILKILEVYGEEAFELEDTFINVAIPFSRTGIS